MEDWKQIPTFPDYEICVDGRIRNKHTGRYNKIYWTNGCATVMLTHNKKYYGKSLQKMLRAIHGVKPPRRNSNIAKCPNCGMIIGEHQMAKHTSNCLPRDPLIEYFEH